MPRGINPEPTLRKAWFKIVQTFLDLGNRHDAFDVLSMAIAVQGVASADFIS